MAAIFNRPQFIGENVHGHGDTVMEAILSSDSVKSSFEGCEEVLLHTHSEQQHVVPKNEKRKKKKTQGEFVSGDI